MLSQDAEIGKIGHLGRPARVGFCGDVVEPSLVPRGFISPLVPCNAVCLAVMFAAYGPPRGWLGNGAENRKNSKIWQRGAHHKLHNSGLVGGANTKTQGH